MIFQNCPPKEALNVKKSSKLHELYINKLMEIYHWEMRMLEKLTLLQMATESIPMQKAISTYHCKKGAQIERLQQVFIFMDTPVAGKKCRFLDLVMQECNEVILSKNLFKDHNIFSTVLSIIHFNMANYQWLISLSPVLGYPQILENLQINLAVEKDVNEKINRALRFNL
jgi:ferritin-like metal-binding protein YciE